MDELIYDGRLREQGRNRTVAYLVPPGAENHASFLTRLSDGSLLCTWFSGAREARPDACIWVARLEIDAQEWSQAVRASGDPERSEQNPVLTELPDGRLWLLYTAQEFGAQDSAVLRQQFSSDGGLTWSDPLPFQAPEGTFIRQAVILLSETEWLLPVFHCPALPGRVWHGDADHSGVLRTDDSGASWHEVAVPESIGAVHMDIVPLDSGALVAFYRSRWGDRVYRSASGDRGATWTAPAPLGIPNGNSSIMATTVDHGGEEVILLVSNPVAGAPGSHLGDREELADPHKRRAPGRIQPLTRHSSGADERLPLTIAASKDAGLTWCTVAVLEDEETIHPSLAVTAGRKKREFSYPSIVASGDVVDVAYSYARRTIKHVRLSASDLLRDAAWPA